MTRRRSPEARERRRQDIVNAAARIFAEMSYADAEMDRVATCLGIAKGTLYLYFASKQDLFLACVDEGMRCMQASISEAAAQSNDPLRRISLGVRAYLEFVDANRGKWRQAYVQLIAEGRVRSDLVVERIMDVVGNLLYGTMFTNHFAGRTASLDEQHASIVDIIFHGILTDSERELKIGTGCGHGGT